MNVWGFIILRCVRKPKSSKLWEKCYDHIRNYFPDIPIVIIDDNSKKQFINKNKPLTYTEIINSEYKGRGDLLPYHYLYKLKFFEKAIIIHDSVFINSEFNPSTEDCKFLWKFSNHRCDKTKR